MSFLFQYINWHYFEAWPKLILLWRNLTLFPFYYFSIPLHLTTLFSPWKRQVIGRERAFSFSNLFSVLSFNLFSRVIGANVRLAVVFFGLFLSVFFTIFSGLLVLIWVIVPALTLPIYLTVNLESDNAESLLKKSKGDATTLALLLFKTKTGQFVANHLGVKLDQILTFLNEQEREAQHKFDINYLANKYKQLELSNLFLEISYLFPPLAEIFNSNNVKAEDVYETAIWYELTQHKSSLIFDLNRIKKLPGIGTEWAYGYTYEFDKFAKDVTSSSSVYPLLLGREKELIQIEEILIKLTENNVFILGEPGVGRHILLATLAYRLKTGQCLPALSHKRILEVDMHEILSAGKRGIHVKGLLSRLLKEAEAAGNCIVAIDEIDKYINSNSEIDLTGVLEKYATSSVPFIGITTLDAYYKIIQPNSTLDKLFETVTLQPPTKETVLLELKVSIAPILEAKHKIIITLTALKKTITDAEKYISTTPFPGKAIELLEKACVFVKTEKKESVLLLHHIDDYLSEKFNLHIGAIEEQEKQKLTSLEKILGRRIINQNQAIYAMSSALRRTRLEIVSAKRPKASFLFLGPTGVGKTETAKAIAEVYFGDETRMLRFDMSQYQGSEGLSRLIGSQLTNQPGELTSKLQDSPFSLLLFDEIEKADNKVLNLLLTLIDEGYIVNHQGKKVDGKNTIIIATSNAGSEYIRELVNSGISGSTLNTSLIDYVLKERIFSPEFINRFNGVIVFSPLSEGQLREVAKLMLKDLNRRLTQKGVSVIITQDLIERLAFYGFDPSFGARAIRRVIEEKVEDQVAQKLLSGAVEKGERIQITI